VTRHLEAQERSGGRLAAGRTTSKVIVVGCGTGGLAVIRSLGRRGGFHIVAASHREKAIGFASRHVAERVVMPHAGHDERAFIDFLMSRGAEWEGALILEATDGAALALSRHKEELRRYYRMATPDLPVLTTFLEKSKLYALADGCGVPHPRTFSPSTAGELEAIAGQVTYPCILKPVYSHAFHEIFKKKMFHARDRSELAEAFGLCLGARQRMMIQEVVVGPESNLERLHAYVDTKGKMIARFFHNKLRQNPPGYGVMRVGVSTPRNEDVESLAERLVTHGGYRGFASIEFKRDDRDGQLKLIEVNVRMPRSLWLPIASGVDFPWVIFNDIVRGERIEIREYVEGLYWIELYPDLLHMFFGRRKERFTWREYLRPYLATHRTFAIEDASDLGPFFRQTRNGIRKLFRGLLPGKRPETGPGDD
jgi:predicted ATP-grasp superfamily ATP-dependent carboligase